MEAGPAEIAEASDPSASSGSTTEASALSRAFWPGLFLVWCLAAALLTAFTLPPFMGPDEPNHAHRANLLTHGRLIGERIRIGGDLVGGGLIDQELSDASGWFGGLPFNPGARVSASAIAAAGGLVWRGRSVEAGFPNTALYPPILYLPQTAAFGLGKALGWSVLATTYLARAANALACALVGSLALLTAGRCRPLMFTVLLLPMSTFLFGTITQDGLIIAGSALGCALISRPMAGGRRMRRAELWAASLCFALVSMPKIAYAVFGLALLFVPAERSRERWAAALLPGVISLAWNLWATAQVWTPAVFAPAGVDAAAQARRLFADPASVLWIAADTLQTGMPTYLRGFVGVLGWADTPLPTTYYGIGFAVLAVAVLLTAGRGLGAGWRPLTLIVPLLSALAAAGIFAVFYLQWSPAGAAQVSGVQGRYFLPMALFAGLALEGSRPLVGSAPLVRRLRACGQFALVMFPLVSLATVEHAYIARYYLT